MPWPNEAARQAARFQHGFARMQQVLCAQNLVPPSQEVVLHAARLHPRLTALEVVMYVVAHHRLPEPHDAA